MGGSGKTGVWSVQGARVYTHTCFNHILRNTLVERGYMGGIRAWLVFIASCLKTLFSSNRNWSPWFRVEMIKFNYGHYTLLRKIERNEKKLARLERKCAEGRRKRAQGFLLNPVRYIY